MHKGSMSIDSLTQMHFDQLQAAVAGINEGKEPPLLDLNMDDRYTSARLGWHRYDVTLNFDIQSITPEMFESIHRIVHEGSYKHELKNGKSTYPIHTPALDSL